MTIQTSDTPIQGIGLSEAAEKIGSLLAGDTDNQDPTPTAESEDAPADDAEVLEADASEDETPASDEGEGTEEEDAAATDEEEQDAEPAQQLVTVKVDGKEEQLPLEEVVKGYQRQADYTRKTMALSEQAKKLESEFVQVQAERQQYSEMLGVMAQQLQESLGTEEPDWDKLYNENPLEYVRQRDIYRDRQERFTAVEQEQARLAEQQMYEQAANLQQTVQAGKAKLAELVPAWKDKARWDADRKALREYGKEKLGFSDEELAQAYDHRAVIALYKAMKYDQMMAKRPKPQPAQGPAPSKPGVPITSRSQKVSDITRAKQRLAKTGHVKDAAKLFESLI
jgi:hypothetical protein